jgi:hypothetical protein
VSNRRRIRPQNPVSAMFAAADGQQIPGGCGHCDAYQEIRAHADGPDLHRITVRHDEWCPWWTARRPA